MGWEKAQLGACNDQISNEQSTNGWPQSLRQRNQVKDESLTAAYKDIVW